MFNYLTAIKTSAEFLYLAIWKPQFVDTEFNVSASWNLQDICFAIVVTYTYDSAYHIRNLNNNGMRPRAILLTSTLKGWSMSDLSHYMVRNHKSFYQKITDNI